MAQVCGAKVEPKHLRCNQRRPCRLLSIHAQAKLNLLSQCFYMLVTIHACSGTKRGVSRDPRTVPHLQQLRRQHSIHLANCVTWWSPITLARHMKQRQVPRPCQVTSRFSVYTA